jgi:cytochrome c peroxidase
MRSIRLLISSGGVVLLFLTLLALPSAAQRAHLTPIPQAAIGQEPITPIPQPRAADPLKVALGEELFADRRLSQDQTRACASCHDVHGNGADALLHPSGANGSELALKTLTVFNAALSFRLNWEGNYRTLEAQAEASLNSAHGMEIATLEILARLKADPQIAGQFRAAYGGNPDRTSLLDALATYERSLVTPGSRFDRWLEGDAGALSAQEEHGYQLFKSFGCISCHQGVNVGGNLFERHGIFRPLAAAEPEILRVPSLRNIAATPPYFHDGSAATLPDAVRAMAAAQLDQSLSDPEVDSIVAFLKTLTGMYRGTAVGTANP